MSDVKRRHTVLNSRNSFEPLCAAPPSSFINSDSTWSQSTGNNQSINYSHKSFMLLLENTAWWSLREHESVLLLSDSSVLVTDWCLPLPPSALPSNERVIMLTTGKWYLSIPWRVAQCASGCNDAERFVNTTTSVAFLISRWVTKAYWPVCLTVRWLLCVPPGVTFKNSQNKQRLFPYIALNVWL